MGIDGFSFKRFEEDYRADINKVRFRVSGTFLGQPFKETLLKKECREGYSKNGILGEVAEIVREKMAGEVGEPEQSVLDGLKEVKEAMETAQRLVDALSMDESIGYFVVTLRCKHKYARGNYTECPLCGEIVK